MEDDVTQKKFGKDIQNAKDKVNMRLTEANMYLQRQNWDDVLFKVEEARTIMNETLVEGTLSKFAGVPEFVNEINAKISQRGFCMRPRNMYSPEERKCYLEYTLENVFCVWPMHLVSPHLRPLALSPVSACYPAAQTLLFEPPNLREVAVSRESPIQGSGSVQ